MKNMVDGHAHACGEYLTVDTIKNKMQKSGCNKVILTPGQYGSKITYSLKNKTLKDPMADVMSKHNKQNKVFMKIMGLIRDIPRGNEYVYQLAEKMPGQVFQAYWVTKANIDKLDEDYERMKFVSVKLHQCWEDFSIDDTYFQKAAVWAEKKGLPLFIHLYSVEEAEKLMQYIEKHPNLKIVIGHLYCVEQFMQLPKDSLKNVYFDLSNFYFVSKERFLAAYNNLGGEHFLLGSDTPYGRDALEDTIKMVEGSEISQEDVERICGGNACRLYPF